MRLKHSILFALLFFVGCDKDKGVGPIDISEIWPLKSGNVWLYRVDEPPYIKDTLKMEITGMMTVSYSGQNYTVAKRAFYPVSEGVPEYQWLYWKGPDGIYFMGGVSPTDTFIVKELELKYPANVGDTWKCRSVAYSLSRKEFYVNDTLTYTLIGNDVLIETAARNFKCYQYRFSQKPADDVGDIWDYNYYYSVETGLIGEETKSQLMGTTMDKYSLLQIVIK
ncbi:MAG: hypothetical protein H3C35_12830 [Bacteroidetes bacterium]|nr:hypothetical protein [Bacteroidota bacterium]